MKKKILVVTPKFPYPSYGACEADRASGIELLIELGYEVVVITKVYTEEYKDKAYTIAKKLGITIIPITYKYLHNRSIGNKIVGGIKRCLKPWYLDGAAYEYSEPEIQKVMAEVLDSFKPDVVWFDYTYLWPLYRLVRKRYIPIITRSINFEPTHFLEEDGKTFMNYLKFVPKFLSELITIRLSDVLYAITPKEALVYKRFGVKNCEVLPLRRLPQYVATPIPQNRKSTPLNVFFSGSTYNVAHNRSALEFLLTRVAPLTEKYFPGEFVFHIFGGKVPTEFTHFFSTSVKKYEYVSDEEFKQLMETMHIAIVPSLFGAGMQQKIFQPLASGFPTITSSRGLVGYPFRDKEEVLCATTAEEFVDRLGMFRSLEVREKFSLKAKERAVELFSETVIKKIIKDAIEKLLLLSA